jgi:hypothetical protein
MADANLIPQLSVLYCDVKTNPSSKNQLELFRGL